MRFHFVTWNGRDSGDLSEFGLDLLYKVCFFTDLVTKVGFVEIPGPYSTIFPLYLVWTRQAFLT